MASDLVRFSILEILDKALMFIELFNDDENVKNTKKKYKIEKIDGKGYGVIATEDIAAFTLIMIEKPLLMEFIHSEKSLKDDLEYHFSNNLNQRQQSLIMSLSNCVNKNADERLKEIYHTNAVGTGDSLLYKSALFPTFARVNHSCLSNCCMYFEGEPTSCIVLKSIRPIRCGEEISIGYIPRLQYEFDRRRDILKSEYGFECRCKELCAFGTKYDELIVEYRECIQETTKLENVERAIDILNEHFYGYPSMMTLWYVWAADACINKALFEKAVGYIERSINVHLKCYSLYKRDRWKEIRRRIVLMKYKDKNNPIYDVLLQKYAFLF